MVSHPVTSAIARSPKASPPISMNGILESLRDPDCLTWRDRMLPLPEEVGGDIQGFRSYVCSMHQVIIAVPKYFFAEPQPETGRKVDDGESKELVNGHSVEGWN